MTSSLWIEKSIYEDIIYYMLFEFIFNQYLTKDMCLLNRDNALHATNEPLGSCGDASGIVRFGCVVTPRCDAGRIKVHTILVGNLGNRNYQEIRLANMDQTHYLEYI